MPEREIGTITKRFRISDNNMEKRRKDWVKYIKLYRSIIDDDKVPTRSNLFIPMTFQIVEQIVPRIVSSITGSRPMISVKPREASDVLASKIHETLMQYQLNQRRFEQRLTAAVRDGIIMGSGCMKSGWIETSGYEGPEHVYVRPFDLFPDPHADNVNDAKYVMQQYFVDKETIESWQRQGIAGPDAGGVDVSEIDGTSTNTGTGDRKREFLKTIGRGRENTDDTRDWVEVIEYWEGDWVTYVANQNNPIRNEPNPFEHDQIPFHFFRDYIFGDEFWGIGEVENLENLQHELNEKRNQRIDAVNFSVNPIILKSYAAGLTDEEMVSAPGQTWNVTDVNEVAPFEIPDSGAVTVREEQLVKQDMKETTSVTDVIRGQAGESFPNTATGVNQLNQNAASRFQHKIRMFESTIERLANQHVALNSQNIEEEQVLRIIGEVPRVLRGSDNIESPEGAEGLKFLRFSPREISGDFDFIAQGARAQTDQQRQRMLLQLLNVVGPFADRLNIIELVKRFMEALDFEDVENLMNPQVRQQIQQDQTNGQARQQAQQQRARQQARPSGPGAEAGTTSPPTFDQGELGDLLGGLG